MEMLLEIVGLHKVRDDMPQLVGTVPLRIGTRMYAFLFRSCVFHQCAFSLSFGYHGLQQTDVQ